MLRYAISDRRQFPGDGPAKLQQVVEQAVGLAKEGVDFFQIREKDLSDETLLALTLNVSGAVRATGRPMQVVLNGPRELATRAGVNWHRSGHSSEQVLALSASCHSVEDILMQRHLASLLLFAPVFEKRIQGMPVQPGSGLLALRAAVKHAAGTPVLALGGITSETAPLCIDAGAAGVAAIRMFLRPASTGRTV